MKALDTNRKIAACWDYMGTKILSRRNEGVPEAGRTKLGGQCLTENILRSKMEGSRLSQHTVGGGRPLNTVTWRARGQGERNHAGARPKRATEGKIMGEAEAQCDRKRKGLGHGLEGVCRLCHRNKGPADIVIERRGRRNRSRKETVLPAGSRCRGNSRALNRKRRGGEVHHGAPRGWVDEHAIGGNGVECGNAGDHHVRGDRGHVS